MNWTEKQLAEALDHLRAISEGMAIMRQDIQEMSACLKRMSVSFDSMNTQVGMHLVELDSPSICPAATP